MKKSLHALERDTAIDFQRRVEFLERIRMVPPEKPIFLDESEVRPHSSLDYRTPDEFAATLRKASYGKDAGFACLEDAQGVSHFATAPATRVIS